MFGSPETTPGGRALKFYSSCRIDVRRIGPVKDGEEIVGSRIKAKVVKNKVAPPFRVCEFDMMYTHGISREADLLDLAILDKIVDKSGSWFNYGDLRLGQGRENAKQYLRDNPELADEIAAKILANRTASGGIGQRKRSGRRIDRGVIVRVSHDTLTLFALAEIQFAVQCPGQGFRPGPAGSGSDSRTCDSAVSGIKTPGLFAGDGEQRLDQAVHAGRALGAESRGVVAPARTASGGNSAPSAPVIWISPLDCMANDSPSERNSTSVFLGSRCASRAGGRNFISRASASIRSTPIEPWPTSELALDLDPANALIGPLAPPSFPDRHSRSSGQPMTGNRLPTSLAEVDVEQLALKISLPILGSRLPQVERSFDLRLRS